MTQEKQPAGDRPEKSADYAWCRSAAGRRKRVAVSGFVFMAVLGTMYAWSVFRNPLREAHGWTGAQVSLAFSFHLLVNGFTCAFLGHLSDRLKGRALAMVSALLLGTGFLIGGLAGQLGLVYLLWLGYGLVGGLASGLGYVNTLKIMLRWYPKQPALATGAAVMGFGLGAALVGQVVPLLVESPALGPVRTFYLLAAVFSGLMLAAAASLRHPTSGESNCPHARPDRPDRNSATLREAMGSGRFYLLWLVMLVNVIAGTTLISNLSPLAQERTGITAVAAGTLIFFGSLFNGAGRIFWAWLAAHRGRREVFLALYSLMALLYLALPFTVTPWLFALLSCLILFAYGGAFGTMPSLVADNFGTAHFGAIYGKILLAFGLGGVAGPLMIEKLSEATGTFTVPLLAVSLILGAGVIMVNYCRKTTAEKSKA